jgi:hypothetical protein
MEYLSPRRTQLICRCCGGIPPRVNDSDCGCGSEVIFENKQLSKDFTQFTEIMAALISSSDRADSNRKFSAIKFRARHVQ